MDSVLVRELMNGMWFVLSFQILVALVSYLIRRMISEPADPRQVWVVNQPWYRELGSQLALSWGTYMVGSTIRAGWIWIFLECQGRLGVGNCGHITQTVWVLFIASGFAIVGGVCTIRIMLPDSWRPWSYLVPAIVAVIVPLVVHAL